MKDLIHAIFRIQCARDDVSELLKREDLRRAFELVPSARTALTVSVHSLDDLEAAARGLFEAAGGLAAHVDCRFHPPCDDPGSAECACLQLAEARAQRRHRN